MDGVGLRLDGHEATYVQRGVFVESDEHIENLDHLEDRVLAESGRVRRILLRLLPFLPLTYYLLHWSNGDDLDALDRRVLAGAATDEDFTDALVAETRTVVCSTCEASFRALVADTGNPVFSSDRARRLREHSFLRRCPVCDGELGGYVIELLD